MYILNTLEGSTSLLLEAEYTMQVYDSAASKYPPPEVRQSSKCDISVVGGFIKHNTTTIKTTPIHVMECELCLPPLHLRREYLATQW